MQFLHASYCHVWPAFFFLLRFYTTRHHQTFFFFFPIGELGRLEGRALVTEQHRRRRSLGRRGSGGKDFGKTFQRILALSVRETLASAFDHLVDAEVLLRELRQRRGAKRRKKRSVLDPKWHRPTKRQSTERGIDGAYLLCIVVVVHQSWCFPPRMTESLHFWFFLVLILVLVFSTRILSRYRSCPGGVWGVRSMERCLDALQPVRRASAALFCGVPRQRPAARKSHHRPQRGDTDLIPRCLNF